MLTHPDVADVAVIARAERAVGRDAARRRRAAATASRARSRRAASPGPTSASAGSSASAASCCGTRCRAIRMARSSSASCARNTCAHESRGRRIHWTPLTGRTGSSPPPTACGSTTATTLRSSRAASRCCACRDSRATAATSRRTALRLRHTRRVLSPDLRGRGRSQHDPNWQNYHPGTYLADLARLLEDAAVDRVILLGTSLGGILSMLICATAPRLPVAVILNDVGPEVAAGGPAADRQLRRAQRPGAQLGRGRGADARDLRARHARRE